MLDPFPPLPDKILFVLAGRARTVPVFVPREVALRVLDGLGIGADDFGSLPAREVAVRCRRQLWPSVAMEDAARERIGSLLALAEYGGDNGVLLYS